MRNKGRAVSSQYRTVIQKVNCLRVYKRNHHCASVRKLVSHTVNVHRTKDTFRWVSQFTETILWETLNNSANLKILLMRSVPNQKKLRRKSTMSELGICLRTNLSRHNHLWISLILSHQLHEQDLFAKACQNQKKI